MPVIGEIVRFMESIAPFESAMEWDNVGLLIGNAERKVTNCVVALDATESAITAAKQAGANLIVTHHPVIFSPLRTILDDSIPAELLREGISVVSAHTNLDLAEGGVNDALCEALGFSAPLPFENEDGLGRIVILRDPMPAAAFAAQVKERLSAPSVAFVDGERMLRRVAVVSGAGGDYLHAAMEQADALLTGEVKHHEWMAAADRGFPLFAAGHWHTEAVVLEPLAQRLAAAFPEVGLYVYRGYPVQCL